MLIGKGVSSDDLAIAVMNAKKFEVMIIEEFDTNEFHDIAVTSISDNQAVIDVVNLGGNSVLKLLPTPSTNVADFIGMYAALSELIPHSVIKINGGQLIHNI